MKARDAAVAEIGEHAATAHLPHIAYRGLLLPDLIATWAGTMDRVVAPQPVQRAAPPAPKAARADDPGRVGRGRAVRLDEPPQQPPPRKPRERKPLLAMTEGMARVQVLRPGIEINGEQLGIGDVAVIPAADATAAALRGAVELVKEGHANG